MEDTKDQRDVFNEKGRELEKILKDGQLSEETKRIAAIALEFGYSAAFCSRTCDMNGPYYQSQKYQDNYNQIKKSLKE